MADENWRRRLMDAYPHLFTRTIGGRVTQCGYPAVEDGWRDIVETAIARIDGVLAKASPAEELHIGQIKEKFGELRIYIDRTGSHPSPDLSKVVREVIELAEARAACTCEICGAVGRLYNDRGYYTTRCVTHGAGFAEAHPAGRELLHYQVSFEGGEGVWSCRRYDRDRDAFVDVPLPPDFNPKD